MDQATYDGKMWTCKVERKELYNCREIARLIGCAPSGVYMYARYRGLPAVLVKSKAGREKQVPMYPHEGVVSWMKNQEGRIIARRFARLVGDHWLIEIPGAEYYAVMTIGRILGLSASMVYQTHRYGTIKFVRIPTQKHPEGVLHATHEQIQNYIDWRVAKDSGFETDAGYDVIEDYIP